MFAPRSLGGCRKRPIPGPDGRKVLRPQQLSPKAAKREARWQLTLAAYKLRLLLLVLVLVVVVVFLLEVTRIRLAAHRPADRPFELLLLAERFMFADEPRRQAGRVSRLRL